MVTRNAQRKARKSKKTASSKASSKKKTAAGRAPVSKFTFDEADRDNVRAVQARILHLKAGITDLRLNYERERDKARTMLAQAEQDQLTVIKNMGRKYANIDEGQWRFNQDTFSFEKLEDSTEER